MYGPEVGSRGSCLCFAHAQCTGTASTVSPLWDLCQTNRVTSLRLHSQVTVSSPSSHTITTSTEQKECLGSSSPPLISFPEFSTT